MFYDTPYTAADLPAELPIFPLTGATLLPRCKLPLNIFEPRYLHMVFDALRGERMIGMIQPKPDDDGFYGIGGAGRITSFEETDDGRVLLRLTGISRFALKSQTITARGYRLATPDWLPFATDLIGIRDATIPPKDVLEALAGYFESQHVTADWRALERVVGSDLIDVMAMNLPFPPEDKQLLLEAHDARARFEVLKKIAALQAASDPAIDTGRRH